MLMIFFSLPRRNAGKSADVMMCAETTFVLNTSVRSGPLRVSMPSGEKIVIFYMLTVCSLSTQKHRAVNTHSDIIDQNTKTFVAKLLIKLDS